jgi:soluble lytic murein transglycosylase-like protein
VRLCIAWFGLAVLACVPVDAGADLVHLRGGRTLSVRTHRVEGDRIVLELRAGGEIVCAADLVERIAADEVPYPEPVSEAPASPSAIPAAEQGATRPFADLIGPLALRHGIDPALVHAVVAVESNYEPAARSPRGAMGLMQLMPATARQYGLADAYEPAANLDAGIRHLRALLDRYELRLALAAYNAGEAAVRRHGGVPPFGETRSYVSRVLGKVGLSSGLGRRD